MLALYGNLCSNVSEAVTINGSTYMSWARVSVTTSGGVTQTNCLWDYNGGGCDVTDLCSAGYNYSGMNGQTLSGNFTPVDTVDDVASTFSGTPAVVTVLANDSDPDVSAQTLTVTAITQGTNGAVTTNGTTVTCTPTNGFAGIDSFTYTIGDGLASCTGQVTVGVPHDQGQRRVPIGEGPLYNSTVPVVPPAGKK